jgi:hypothetical protein
MAKLDTVVLISKSSTGKAVIVDSINSFKSSLAEGFMYLQTNIPAEWVNMVLEGNTKAAEVAKASLQEEQKAFLNEYYDFNEDGTELRVTERGKSSQSLNAHLLNLRLLGLIDFEPIFTSKADNKPMTYGSEIGYMVRSKI